ncbi:MAG: hypothetical protein EAZ95_15185 [Bacteroidetes bacterium]|nr:MAG: hypothetical protein EAZ95_15185 [Bacteroidota bacterium]
MCPHKPHRAKARIKKYELVENRDYTFHKVVKRQSWATEGRQVVSARELYAFLEIETRFRAYSIFLVVHF